uniref:Carboxypeptidase regulatory-like domain-containing protein n=1 Tax=candidate division WOR-3 bacterium TaxID=2052148 RepID=A0A7C4CB40_UNCW3
MRRIWLVGSLLLPLAAAANPVLLQVLSEFQTAPDSLERIELFPYSGISSFPYPLGGTQVITNAGTAVINPGVQFDNESSYVVINRTNTTGTFALGDIADSIALEGPTITGSLTYPGNPWRNHLRAFAPPAGMSSAIHKWREIVLPDTYYVFTWYLDSTPTFGARNDDNGGGVYGMVRDEDSTALAGATVTLAGPRGAFVATTSSGPPSPHPRGYYDQKPTGPGRFQMTVTLAHYRPWTMAESLELGVNELRQIDVVLAPDSVGIAERPEAAGFLQAGWREGRLVVFAPEPGPAVVNIFTGDGRRNRSERMLLRRGANPLAVVPTPAPGVYFVSVRSGAAAVRSKVVVY